MSKFLDRQYGHRPDWSPGTNPKPRGIFRQPEEIVGRTSDREDEAHWNLISSKFRDWLIGTNRKLGADKTKGST